MKFQLVERGEKPVEKLYVQKEEKSENLLKREMASGASLAIPFAVLVVAAAADAWQET